MCIGCDKRLTIEHILLTCSDLIEIRECHFTAKSLRMLFQDISTTNFKNPKHIGGSSFSKCGLKKKISVLITINVFIFRHRHRPKNRCHGSL